MSLPWHSNDERNYVCLRKIVTDVVSEGLRTIFKQEWNNRYQATAGAWDDTGVSGILLFNREKARAPGEDFLAKYKNGNTKEWDCTVLCDAILYSKSIRESGLNPSIKAEVNNLRMLRNKVFHAPEGKLADHVFEDCSEKIRKSFRALGLSPKDLDEVKMGRKCFTSFQVLPPHPTHDVVSRRATVSSINDELHKLYSNNDGNLTYLYISGNPGSGKSQLAREIGESHYNDIIDKQGELTFVMTLNAKSLDTLLESYEDFARRVNCPDNVIFNIINSEETSLLANIRHLRSETATKIKNYKTWLIIADNVEDLKLVSSLLPQLKDKEWSNGQVLITTHDSRAIPSNTSFTTHVPVSKGMAEEESCHLLATISETGYDPMLTNVAKKLDHQPLALAAAAVYVKQAIEAKASPGFSWRDYREKLKQGKRQRTEKLLRDTNPAYSLTMTSAVLLAVEKAAEYDENLSIIFKFLSLVSHDSLPLEIAVNFVCLCNEDIDKDDVGVKIQKCSLILTEVQEVVSIRLHRVVHEAVKVHTSCYQNEEIVAAARTLYLFKERKDERTLVPHLKAFHIATTSASACTFLVTPSLEIMEILLYFGARLRHYGELLVSKHFFIEALDLSKKLYNSDNVRVAQCYSNLGHVCCSLADLNQAKYNHKLARDIYLKQLGSEHIDVATSYDDLGKVYFEEGKLQKANKYHKLALEIRRKQLGSDNILIATSYRNLGIVSHNIGELEQSKQYFKDSLEIRRKQLGLDHAKVAASYHSLGTLYRDLGDLQQAKQCHDDAQEIFIRQLGENHTHTAISRENLGTVLHDLGDLHKAKDYLHLAQETKIKNLGPRHPRVAVSYNFLGRLHKDLGDLEQAKHFHKQGLEILYEQLGSCHYKVATSLDDLAEVYRMSGELQQSIQQHKQALDIREMQLCGEHFHLATSHNNLGEIHRALGDLQQAKQHHEKALKIRIKQLGPCHHDTATSYDNLGCVHFDLGIAMQNADELRQALTFHNQALSIRVEKLESQHFKVATSYNNLGDVHRALGNLNEAKQFYQKSLDIRVKQLGSNHPHTTASRNSLGSVCEQLGEQD